jgi:hypothetical protein
MYDRLDLVARRRGESMSQYVRIAAKQRLLRDVKGIQDPQ